MEPESISDQLERRATAERIITRFYTRLERRPPLFLWFDDPVSGLLACSLLTRPPFDAAWHPLWANTFSPLPFKMPVGGQIDRTLWWGLEGLLHREATTRLTPALASRDFLGRFWFSFWLQLEAHVGSGLSSKLRSVRLNPRFAPPLVPASDGGFWGGVTGRPRARPGASQQAAARLDELQHACGWWSPRTHAVICSDGPRRIRVDGEGRLHAEDGPAIVFSTHHRIHAWHGIRVPPEWIERRGTPDPSTLLTWPDVDQRLAATQIFGWAKLLEHRPERVIHADPDPQIGTLFECDLPAAGPSRFLRVRCGTGREFVLNVPRNVHTAREANAWTYSLNGNEYELEARA